MNRRGRPVLGAVAGLFLGLFLGLDLLFLKVVKSDSPLLLGLPIVLLLVGLGLGITAPLGRRR